MEAVRIGHKGLKKGKVKTGHRSVQVSKSNREEVLFVAQGQGGPWTVVFDKREGSPFAKTSFTVPQGSFERTGPPTSSAVVHQKYRYSVYDAAGKRKDDPDVDIDN